LPRECFVPQIAICNGLVRVPSLAVEGFAVK
jgi:hypothetical protein